MRTFKTTAPAAADYAYTTQIGEIERGREPRIQRLRVVQIGEDGSSVQYQVDRYLSFNAIVEEAPECFKSMFD